LGLSISQAAKIADVDRATWTKWEKGKSRPYDSNYVSIERALQWPARYVSGIIAGRVAEQTSPAVPPKPESVPIPLEDWALLTPEERTILTRMFIGVRHREQQRRGA